MTHCSIAGIILAAGKGTRMKSDRPKALHAVCGVPMAELIGRTLKAAGVQRPLVVVGHEGNLLIEALGPSYDFAWQREQKGTGHATMMASEALGAHQGPVLVLPGDTPLISDEAVARLLSTHREFGAQCTVATMSMPDPFGYGRIIRDERDLVTAIVEHKDATEEQRRVREVNSGIFCFDCQTLFSILPKLRNDNAQGEYYLTDVVAEINRSGGQVRAYQFEDPDLLMGVNDRWQLAVASKKLRERVLKHHALEGVTIIDPDTTYIGVDVSIGPDTVIEPNTCIEGETTIGSKCTIGPTTRIIDSSIGDNCIVMMSHLNEATMLEHARCGPFANLRPGAIIGVKAKVGNFVEVKNAKLGHSAAVSHLSYIGDGSVGDRTNIGAGTIFCNYDGFKKSRTEVGDDAFVGSNSTIVAPVTIGDGAMVAAGSVVTHDVPSDALAIGRGRQENKEEWAAHWRAKKKG